MIDAIGEWEKYKNQINSKIQIIKLNTTKCKKILTLMLQLTNNTDLVYEPLLYKQICDNIKINYIQIKPCSEKIGVLSLDKFDSFKNNSIDNNLFIISYLLPFIFILHLNRFLLVRTKK